MSLRTNPEQQPILDLREKTDTDTPTHWEQLGIPCPGCGGDPLLVRTHGYCYGSDGSRGCFDCLTVYLYLDYQHPRTWLWIGDRVVCDECGPIGTIVRDGTRLCLDPEMIDPKREGKGGRELIKLPSAATGIPLGRQKAPNNVREIGKDRFNMETNSNGRANNSKANTGNLEGEEMDTQWFYCPDMSGDGMIQEVGFDFYTSSGYKGKNLGSQMMRIVPCSSGPDLVNDPPKGGWKNWEDE